MRDISRDRARRDPAKAWCAATRLPGVVASARWCTAICELVCLCNDLASCHIVDHLPNRLRNFIKGTLAVALDELPLVSAYSRKHLKC